MASSSWINITEQGDLTPESRQLITYFMKNTTEKIFRHMNLMGVKSQSVRNSIHAVVYNNAGGNDALVRFYYLNVARFIELDVGRFCEVDWDLQGEGVKAINVDISELKSGNYSPLTPSFHGTTNKGIAVGPTGRNRAGKPVDRTKRHQARPFLMNTIRQEMRRTAERLATQMAYTHTVYMVKGLTGMLALDQADKEWRKQMGYIEQMRQKMGAMPMYNLDSPFIGEAILGE